MKNAIWLFVVTLLLGLQVTNANASIIDTEVAVGMKIEYGTPSMSDGSISMTDSSIAGVALEGTTTGIEAHSYIYLHPLNPESTTVHFDLGWDSNGYSGNGYIGDPNPYSNYADITYHAVTTTILDYEWDFSYDGENPFGLQIVSFYEDAALLEELGDFGQVGSFAGMDTLTLLGGNDYLFRVEFIPNVSGSLSGLQGDLKGSFALEFTPVPEPSTFLLLGGGLAGLAFIARRRRTE